MKLIWIDLETTGLVPEKCEILELAVAFSTLEQPFVFADPNLASPTYTGRPVMSERLRVFSWVFGLDMEEQARLDPFIKNMHTKNGLLAECCESNLGVKYAEDELLRIVPEVTDKDDRPTLAGASVHFDLAFIRVHMPRLAKRLSHRVYDTSAIRLFCRSLGMPKPPKGNEAHRATEDVYAAIEQARTCKEWIDQGWS